MIGGVGAAGVATATGLSLGTQAYATAGGQDGERRPVSSPFTESTTLEYPEALANPIVQTLGAIDFQGAGEPGAYAYASPGGVLVSTAPGTWFNGGLRLPVGATIVSASVYVNPNGVTVSPNLNRYNPLSTDFETLASGTSTTGTARETIAMPLAAPHVVEAGWNYRFTDVRLDVGGAILYGAQVTYTIPSDPVGHFVPFVGVNPRVYDSRTSGIKLGANEERVIPLGVPGSVQAAVFNLTVTQTQAQGFVSCFRADVGFPGNSSINWYEPGADVANLVVCAVDPGGQIRLRGGRDATHVVIDLIGTFV